MEDLSSRRGDRNRSSARIDDRPLHNKVAGLALSGMAIIEAAELVEIPVTDRVPTDLSFTPTPTMIREHCFAIQSGWTQTERKSRDTTNGGDPVETHTVWVRDLGEV